MQKGLLFGTEFKGARLAAVDGRWAVWPRMDLGKTTRSRSSTGIMEWPEKGHAGPGNPTTLRQPMN